MIGRGGLALPGANSSDVLIRFEIHNDGIRFFYPISSSQGKTFGELLSDPVFAAMPDTTEGVNGHLVLATLPASPHDAFYFEHVALTFSDDTLTLGFDQTDNANQAKPFAHGANGHTYCKNFNVVFTSSMLTPLTVSGEITLALFDQDVGLAAVLDNSGLNFKYQPATPSQAVTISQLGELDLTTLEIRPAHPRWNGLQVLYAFDEGQGDAVHDSSGAGQAIDLQIKTPDTVSWQRGSLEVRADSFIASADNVDDRRNAPLAKARKIIDACMSSNEISIAAWIKPGGLRSPPESSTPNRIVTLSKDTSHRNFTLGQDNDDYVVRLRTTKTSANGTKPNLRAKDKVTQDLVYVVYSRDADGNARLYINGDERAQRKVTGNLSKWRNYELALANEFHHARNSRSWTGEFHRIELYARALGADEVYRNYYPSLITAGNISLAAIPAPLSVPLPAVLEHFPQHSLLTIEDANTRPVTPQFLFEQIRLIWQKPSLADWTLREGQVKASLWGNPLQFTTHPGAAGSERVLPLATVKDETLELRLDVLGSVTFSNLTLRSLQTDVGAAWEVSADTEMTEVIVLPPQRREFDFKIDFRLLDPSLALHQGRIVLSGQWLGKTIALYGVTRGERFVLQGRVDFELPFFLQLGPVYQPISGVKLSDRIGICQTDDCRQIMQASLLLELSAEGFMALVEGTFQWHDETATVHDLRVPQFPIYTLPVNRNAVLQTIVSELRANTDEIFAPVIKHESDYFFAVRDDKPLIYYGDSAAPPQAALQTLLPKVFATDSAVQISSDNDLFQLQQSAAHCTLRLTPAGHSQADVDTDYRSFIAQLAQTEAMAGLHAGAVNLVKMRIAERLPLTLDRLLHYYYGFEPSDNYVDLQGGMRLRVDYQNYQSVPPSDRTASNGFVGSGSVYYQVHSYRLASNSGHPQLVMGFDGFLAGIQSVISTDIAQNGAGGIIDLLRTGYRKPYYRLFYPSQFSGPGGRIGAERVVTLVGADNLNALQQASEEYLQQGQVQETNDRVSAFFRGRAVVIPEIAVYVQEQPVYVPVGTTLRQVLERYSGLPAGGIPGQDLRGFGGAFRPRRLIHEGVDSTPAYRFINFDPYAASADGSDIFDMPVVKGDRFYL